MIRILTTLAAAVTATFVAAGMAHADQLTEGTQTVGVDVAPGLYHTSGPTADDAGCSWTDA